MSASTAAWSGHSIAGGLLSVSSTIVKAAIHPGIGIARLGDSPDGFFIGPEVRFPCRVPPNWYKDASGALKRQAARFRIYGLDDQNRVVAELDSTNARITWT